MKSTEQYIYSRQICADVKAAKNVDQVTRMIFCLKVVSLT